MFWRLVLSTAICLACFAQAPTAEITGTIRDISGAVVPEAEISATDEDTGFSRKTRANGLGLYTLPLLPPGSYRVSVQQQGFRTAERAAVRLHVSDKVALDFSLEVGALTETVRVESQAPLLQTEGASQGAVIDNAKISNLPLNGRNPFSLAALTPGVQPGGGFFTARVFQEQAYQSNFNVNGGASFQNDILLDGTSNTVTGHGQLAMTPSVDAIEEFKVQTSNYSAEYGRSGGGIINIVTKSGTNQLRGTAYEFLRNKVLDANNFFNNRAGVERQPFVFNQYGVTVGGPVVIPKAYDGRNKTFFFFAWEGVRARRARFYNGTVPTEAMRRGDFSGLRQDNGQPIVIYNPMTTRREGSGYVRDPFPGNVIPASMQDQVASNVTTYYPLPNFPSATVVNNYIANASQGNDLDIWQWRVDHNISTRNRLFVRMSYDKQKDLAPNYYGNIANDAATYSGSVQPDWHATVSDTHTISPTVLLDLRAGYARNGFDRQPISAGFDPTELGLPRALAQTAQVLYFPSFQPGGYSGVGARANDLFFLGADTYSFTPQMTIIRGRHTMKAGGDFRVLRHNTFNASSPVGSYSFSRAFTQGPDPLRSSLSAGDSYASMLLGAMSGGSAMVRAYTSWQTKYYAGYFQDDIKVTSTLTLNLGLRYDYESPRTERFDRLSFFNFDAPSPIAAEVGIPDLRGGLDFVGVNGNPRGWNDPDRNNFGPRFGFAWQAAGKTALRGGYGLTYLPAGTNNNGYGAGQEGFSVSTPLVNSTDGGLTPFTLLAHSFADGLQQPTGSSLGMRTLLGQGVRGDPRWVRVGYMQQWSLNIQHELPGAILIEGGYVGSRGIKIPMTFQLNQLPDEYLSLGSQLLTQVPNPFRDAVSVGTLSQPTVTYGQLLRPYPQFTGVSFPQNSAGASVYHAFQLRVEKRFSKGLTLLGAYTNSKLISDTDSQKTWIEGEFGSGVQNSNNLRLERSLAPQDVSQRLVVNYIYELPFARANRWIGGWSITGITTLQTGRPLGLTTATNNTNSYGGGSRPNSIGESARLSEEERSIARWFDTSVFTQPEPFTFGTTGRTLPDVREPGLVNFDFSAMKNFPVTERVRIQFRAEFFNLFNTPQFGRPGTVLGNAQFGIIGSQANSPRQVQFGLKLLF